MSDNIMKIDNDTQALLDALDVIDLDKDPAFVLDSIKAKFVEDVCQAMKANNISQSELAKRLGKTNLYVSRVLNETAKFTLSSIVEISIALGCSVELKINDQPNKSIKNEFIEKDNFKHLKAPREQDHKNDDSVLIEAA